MLDGLKKSGFDVLALHHAEAVLQHDLPEALVDIEAVLSKLRIPVTELVAGGGGEALGTQRMRREFTEKGWLKQNVEITKYVNFIRKNQKKEKPDEKNDESKKIAALSHEIDHVKRFGEYVAALEIEWNNKDPFFDRDLESFKRLHAEGAISIGLLITRGISLHENMAGLISRFANEKNINSLDDLEPFGYDPTKRQREIIAKAMKSGKGFREAWADAFVADKFGEATTHWGKLSDRVSRGVGNPCPLLLIGIPGSVVTF